MSGGVFDYACFDVEDASQVFSKMDQLRAIEEWLRAYNKHPAADEVLLYIKEMETHQRRIEVIGKRISNLLHAAEWTASGDTNIEAVDIAYWKLMGIEPPK